ncbi:acriflavin resistance protein [Gottschalkia acidurici 9a]|uniref:Acriflavin resistance protein n=1 Tax=Gottschalkia acidurici (strain ATCC 7906 / DSM 604 / BCRC 14475 / CIP 104303 / KCTC 5404 / NCIMB 10678 / 9a) TaxID=1128398 RepID=K0AXB3_GOTA9|nr:efflux RND transporter permease subunit [Gottschalkia acidurici]AFS77387.1 acriflavin resistance protein [Gottschalkia acidurici 9a]
MNLSKISVNKPVTTIMVALIVVILGAISLSRLPIDLLPEMDIPVSVVMTTYEGVGPQEIEELITKPLENSVSTVSNIKQVSSTSSEGASIIIAEFTQGTDMDFAALEMREKIDLVKGFLPQDAKDPMVIKVDPNSMPVLQLAITGNEDLSELQTIGEDTIQPRLERIAGVASVSISGGYENQIEIIVNEERLKGYGLSIDSISQVLRAENLNLPGGEVTKGSQKLTIRTKGQFTSLDEIKNLSIPLSSGGVVALKDVSEVNMTYKDISSIVKSDGKRSMSVSIQKQSGTNTVKVVEAIHDEIKKLQKDLPGVKIDVVMDQSVYIKDSINNVVDNAISGAVLAVAILYLFLRNVRSTLVVATSIPMSIICTFILMYFNGITLNLMTLGGLVLGIGMLVDNAIVVLENIYRFREEGHSKIEAAVKGAGEVGMAVIASTLTTLAVFLPIAFVDGMAAVMFKELALTISMSLIASLLVSITIVPMLSSKLLEIDETKEKKRRGIFKILGIFDFFHDIFDKVFEKVENIYKRILRWALNHRKSTILIALGIFLGTISLIPAIGMEFFPNMDQGEFTINVKLPEGSELDKTDNIVQQIEGHLEKIKEIDAIFSSVGSSGNQMQMGSNGSNNGTINVRLKDLKDRNRSVDQVADEARNFVKDIPGAEISVQVSSMTSGFGGGSPVNIKIKGDNLDKLEIIGEDVKEIVESVEGTREVKSSMEEGIPEVQIVVNRENASHYGLTAAQIASSVKGNISGQLATRYKLNEEEIDVFIKGDSIYKESISNLRQSSINTPLGITIPLEQVANVVIEKGPITIDRESQVRTISVSSQIVDRDLGSITNDIEEKLSKYDMPEGYTYESGGENKEMMESFKSLLLALLLALVLVYMVIASQFESLLHPFTIMLSVPLAFSGGALGLFVTGRSLSVPAFIGVITLAGVVVNNAIVLIDYIEIRRKSGEERQEAIINAGPIRLRPILMTTLTTVLGLIPMALGIGDGAEAMAPMATVVVGGLTLSTVLTLVFVPVMYTMFDDLTKFIKRKIFRNKTVEA